MSRSKSPFKFLDPYTRKDREIFFGRDLEIDLLYEMVFETNLILVYGPSGSGKTSLVQCGLASKFKPTDWFDIFIRRRNNINESVAKELEKHAQTPFSKEATFPEKIESLFLDYFKPIFLIFDQFEELYILGTSEEREIFISNIKSLLAADLNCHVIIVMREEYIAQLYDFEREIPQLFEKRMRVEPMSISNVAKVIKGTTEKYGIDFDEPEIVISKIIENISDQKSGIQLPYLQVYLDRLYREALAPQ